MIIVAGGDSFIFGAELQDQQNGPSNSTYTALLANQHTIGYHCAAWPGNSNAAISRMTMTACEELIKEHKHPLAIVTWTFTNRYEFRFNYNTGQRISPWHSINSWNINHAATAEFAESFFKHVGNSEYYELYSSLKEILFLQNYFKTNNISYLFLPADNHFYQHPNYDKHRDSYIDAIYTQIDWNKWFFFNIGKGLDQTEAPRGFYQWAVENKYRCGIQNHPLEEAHSAAAELIKEKFNELVTQSDKSNSIRNTLQT